MNILADPTPTVSPFCITNACHADVMGGQRPGDIGEHLLGDFARYELGAARRDPRSDRGEESPIADFFDAIRETGRFRRSVIGGVGALASGVVGEGSVDERQAQWERIELGRAEQAGDFAWLNASTLWSLHSALDAYVEALVPAWRQLVARMASLDVVRRVAEEHPELAERLPDDAMRVIAEAAANACLEGGRYPKPRGNGAIRWEEPLATIGLAATDDRPIPDDLDGDLVEVCVLRDVFSHRGGRIDAKAVADCPTLRPSIGEFVRLGTEQTLRYGAAVTAYGTAISHRVLARIDGSPAIDLNEWAAYRFLA